MATTAIQLSQACAESWDAMPLADGGRHCAACQKTVVDFTWHTDAEILAYLASATRPICGRLRADQLDRPLRAASPPPRPAPRWRAWLAAALALWGARAGSSLGAAAHAGPAPARHHAPAKARRARPAARVLRGVVRDAATHEPLAGVAVFLKGENRSATTDSSGCFRLRVPAKRPAGRRRYLVLHRMGYLSRQLAATTAPGLVQAALHPDPAVAGVEVIGVSRESARVTLIGGISSFTYAPARETPPPTPPAARPARGFFRWFTRLFQRT